MVFRNSITLGIGEEGVDLSEDAFNVEIVGGGALPDRFRLAGTAAAAPAEMHGAEDLAHPGVNRQDIGDEHVGGDPQLPRAAFQVEFDPFDRFLEPLEGGPRFRAPVVEAVVEVVHALREVLDPPMGEPGVETQSDQKDVSDD